MSTDWFPYKPSLRVRIKLRIRFFWERSKYKITARKDKKPGYFWHVHHEELFEYSFDVQERINYIVMMKPKRERALRLKLLRRITDQPEGDDLLSREKMEALHKVDCDPNCPWNGRTIFTARGQELWGYN